MTWSVSTLDASTWRRHCRMVERNSGIFGRCWCIGFHPECGQRGIDHRAGQHERVLTDGAHAALILDIADPAGGLVEAISEVTAGREAPGRFLFSATVELFEDLGFERGRQLGKHAYLARRTRAPA